MDISKKDLVRNNKRYIKSTPVEEVVKPLKVRNQPAPTQDKIRHFVKENPNCTIADIYKGVPDHDQAYIRRCIRNMVESHHIRQRFTIS